MEYLFLIKMNNNNFIIIGLTEISFFLEPVS